jgi:hypothetical protein
MSSIIMPSRRLFLGGLIAAPAVIAANRLMPVKSFDLLDVPQEEWVLIKHFGEKPHYSSQMAWMPRIKFATQNTVDLSEYRIVKTVEVPVRTNYRTVHAGTELLQIYNAPLIA